MLMSILVAALSTLLCFVMDILVIPVIKDVCGKTEKKIIAISLVVFNVVIVGLLLIVLLA